MQHNRLRNSGQVSQARAHAAESLTEFGGASQPSPGSCSRIAYGVRGQVSQARAHAAESLTEFGGKSAKPGLMQQNRLRSLGASQPSPGSCSRIAHEVRGQVSQAQAHAAESLTEFGGKSAKPGL